MTKLTPTPEQATIVEHIRSEPDVNTMIDAVAGAAKTSTCVMAAEHIGQHFEPLAIAFNKRNAVDLQERMPSYFDCRTLNALGHNAWQTARGSKRLELDDDKLFKIAKTIVQKSEDDSDSMSTVLQLVRAAKNIGLVPNGAPLGVKGLVEDHPDNWDEIAFVKGLDVSDLEILWARDVLMKSINEAFQGRIDFADQIYMSTLFGGVYRKRHTVIVDESQDLSPLNHLQLKKVTGTRLIAVGDPYQAIYAFRGADAQSMSTLAYLMGDDGFSSPSELATQKIGKGKFKRLGLTKSFRVPKSIGKRQRGHVAHFGTMDWLPEGRVEQWPRFDTEADEAANLTDAGWSIDSIPPHAFVVCRNNAPLMKLGFAMIKRRRPVKILGRDIGASLASSLLKATGKSKLPVKDCYDKVREWREKELAKCGDSESKKDIVHDRAECMEVMLDAGAETKDATNLTTAQMIRDMFSDKQTSDATLSSGHRIKGMESKFVIHLDPWRVPSKFALKAAEHGDPRALVQEKNLKYVIETRTQDVLVEANLDDCLEVGE